MLQKLFCTVFFFILSRHISSQLIADVFCMCTFKFHVPLISFSSPPILSSLLSLIFILVYLFLPWSIFFFFLFGAARKKKKEGPRPTPPPPIRQQSIHFACINRNCVVFVFYLFSLSFVLSYSDVP